MRDYQRLRERDADDARRMAHAISAYLHNCVGTSPCPRDRICDMCTHAARLAVQHYRPILERRFVESVGRVFDVPTGWSPPCSD